MHPARSGATTAGSPPEILDHLAVAGTAQGKIYVYRLPEMELVTDRWSAHTAKVTCIAWSPDGSGAVSAGLDTNLYVWSLKAPGRRTKVVGAHKEGVNACVWVGDTVYTVGVDASVKKWKVKVD